MPATILEFQQIEKRFFGVRVLRDISFSLQHGRILGLVGENGAGKSTLMNILGGVFPADAGRILFNGNEYTPKSPRDAFSQGIAFIHQELNLFENLSIADTIFIHQYPTRFGLPWIDRAAMYEKTKKLLEMTGLALSPDTLVEELSPGERQLVEIAKALSIAARVILFDEPTTSLTSQEIQRLFALIERLRAQGIAMIYISHALGDVMKLCDDIVVLRDGEMAGTGEKTSFTAQSLISLMVGREMAQLFPERSAVIHDEILLEARSVSYPDIVHDISFTLCRGEILGIAGLMGSGRTELARILFGLDPMRSGTVLLQGRELAGKTVKERIASGLAFLTEDRRSEGLMMEASIYDNIALASLSSLVKTPLSMIPQGALTQNIQTAADRVLLKCSSLEHQTARTLSGGNQQKIVLAKWLLRKPAVLIVDEPTRGIDVGAKYEIYKIMNQITADGGSVLFISSEIEELLGMCDRIMVMNKGEIKKILGRDEFSQEAVLCAALGEQ